MKKCVTKKKKVVKKRCTMHKQNRQQFYRYWERALLQTFVRELIISAVCNVKSYRTAWSFILIHWRAPEIECNITTRHSQPGHSRGCEMPPFSNASRMRCEELCCLVKSTSQFFPAPRNHCPSGMQVEICKTADFCSGLISGLLVSGLLVFD